jgi:hypothetical protein
MLAACCLALAPSTGYDSASSGAKLGDPDPIGVVEEVEEIAVEKSTVQN